ncbi:hypothetical protein PR048_020030 [Dryococelus australis]|uniref:Uncharacterized protein n=1 Tax=Dryococelus australis TaxID=614101 RepID=A0ABQ9H548_9NEOP|nr:hypothetical protein PR048_020030 [Dryococelus australis]
MRETVQQNEENRADEVPESITRTYPTPKWVNEMNVDERETCLCIRHTNTKLLVQAVHKYGLFYSAKPRKLYCVYLKLQTSKETYTDKNGNQKTAQKMINLLEMDDRLQNSVNGYAVHVGRVIHQQEALKYQKENLQFNEAVIYMDFSENYNCKFAEETQAFHFDGSRKPVYLHTVVTYLHDKNSQLDMPYTIQSFCTLSDCLDHGVHTIWTHLKPILKTLPDSVITIHFWSGSPSTQYRNKKCSRDMFSNVQRFTWNYHEAGHRKGDPGGIRDTCKRTADNLVPQVKDIPDVATLISSPKENIDNVTLEEVTKDDIDTMEQRYNFKDIKPL